MIVHGYECGCYLLEGGSKRDEIIKRCELHKDLPLWVLKPQSPHKGWAMPTDGMTEDQIKEAAKSWQ